MENLEETLQMIKEAERGLYAQIRAGRDYVPDESKRSNARKILGEISGNSAWFTARIKADSNLRPNLFGSVDPHSGKGYTTTTYNVGNYDYPKIDNWIKEIDEKLDSEVTRNPDERTKYAEDLIAFREKIMKDLREEMKRINRNIYRAMWDENMNNEYIIVSEGLIKKIDKDSYKLLRRVYHRDPSEVIRVKAGKGLGYSDFRVRVHENLIR